MSRSRNVYDDVGGEPTFRALVDGFYERVATDPVLRPMYPDDLQSAKERLTLFLMQFWGGPKTYSEQRGNPRLRMRHLPFPIDTGARDVWVGHMLAALDDLNLPAGARAGMAEYFEQGATFMVNSVASGPAGREPEGEDGRAAR